MKLKKYYQIITLFILFTNFLLSQTYQNYNPNDERFKVLALKKAKNQCELYKKQFDNAQKLFEKQLISSEELDRHKNIYENSKLNYDQYYLSVIFDKPHLSVLKAEKTKDSNGNTLVFLKIKNSSGGSFGIEDTMQQNETDNQTLSPNKMNNIYISLKDENGSIISQPYEYHLKSIKLNKTATIEFSLLKDVDYLTVSANYGDKYDNKKIYLKRKSGYESITISPDIYAQETECGKTAIYRLNIEYYGDTKKRYKLKIDGLPKYFNHEFINSKTNSTISSVTFSEKNYQQNIILKVSIPEKNGDNVKLDENIKFSTNLLTQANKKAGNISLEVKPTGKAEMEFVMNNMFFSIEKEEVLSIYPLKIKNSGQKEITDISFEFILPPDWEYKLSPKKINILKTGEEQKLTLEIIPAKDALPGIYQTKIKTIAKALNRQLSIDTREIKIEVKDKSNPMLTIFMLLLAIVIVGGVIIIIVKITKN